MDILVLNGGSSSLKFQVINPDTGEVSVKGHVDGIGLSTCKVILNGHEWAASVPDFEEAVRITLGSIDTSKIGAIGHRVVHGGDKYSGPALITDGVIADIRNLEKLAPLHNPINLQGILACRKLLPKVPQVAVFDTAFHQTMPKEAHRYAIPKGYAEKYGIRKYGFHGTSHKYLVQQTCKILGKKEVNIITCHLGNGASVACIKHNKSIDTSMGFTPLQGLIMGTRSGDIDPEVVSFLERNEKLTASEIISILNKKSGLLGLTGDSDVRAIRERSLAGDEECALALDMFCYRVMQYIGAYMAAMGEKTDAIVFSAGIGQGAYYLRKTICDRLRHLGVILHKERNSFKGDILVSADDSPIKVLVIPTNEELLIAQETAQVVREQKRGQ